MNASALRATLLTAAVTVLAVGVSVPALAKDKPWSKSELKNQIANAEKKADHERIAQAHPTQAAATFARGRFSVPVEAASVLFRYVER